MHFSDFITISFIFSIRTFISSIQTLISSFLTLISHFQIFKAVRECILVKLIHTQALTGVHESLVCRHPAQHKRPRNSSAVFHLLLLMSCATRYFSASSYRSRCTISPPGCAGPHRTAPHAGALFLRWSAQDRAAVFVAETPISLPVRTGPCGARRGSAAARGSRPHNQDQPLH